MKLFNKTKPETVAPLAVFDLLAAEKAFLKQFEVKLTGSTLCVKTGGKFVPATDDVISKFTRSHMILTGQLRFWERGTIDDFLAFIKAGL